MSDLKQVHSERDWPEDFKLENGNYYNICTTCRQEFMGYKRRFTCKVCAGQGAPTTPREAARHNVKALTARTTELVGEVIAKGMLGVLEECIEMQLTMNELKERAEKAEAELAELRRTQPEATAPAQDDLRNGLCDKSWTKIRYKGFTYSFPASMPLAQVFAETLALTDEDQAQDLSAAILAIECIPCVTWPHNEMVTYRKGHRHALEAAASLASSANALSAGDRVDAERYRWLRNESWAGYNASKHKPEVFETVTMVRGSAGNFKTILAEEALDAAVDAAILQSQKGGSNG